MRLLEIKNYQDNKNGKKGEDIIQNAEQKSPKNRNRIFKRIVQEIQDPNIRNSRKRKIIPGNN